jgi:hypothetical protein
MKTMRRRAIRYLFNALLLTGLLASCSAPNANPPRIEAGSGRFWYQDPADATGQGLWVRYHRPARYLPTTAIVFVMHGNLRNAWKYRDNWSDLSERYGFLIVAPEFDGVDFPSAAYHRGNAYYNSGKQIVPVERRLWTFPMIDRIFETVRRITGNRNETFSIFGHSAGGQFVHRYLTFTGGPKVDVAVAANAGWYTIPNRTEKFPYGLGGTAVSDADLRTLFGKRLIVMLGGGDVMRSGSLRQTPAANRQGNHRLARGNFYFDAAKREAERVAVSFNWRLETVPGVGHDNRAMAIPAAAAIARALGAAYPVPGNPR